jgi:transcriptional regulator with XRE-family HTH domain
MFNTRLKRLREWRNMTQKELGLALNFSQQTIHKWELGSATPDPDTLVKLAKVLNVPMDVLLGQSMVSEDSAGYLSAEDYLTAFSQSNNFISLFNIDPKLSQDQLNGLSHQLYQMTLIITEPYHSK